MGFALVWRQEFWGGEESIWDRRISPQQKHKDFYDSRCAKGDFIGEVEIIMRGFIRCFLIGPFISILLFASLVLLSPANAAANEDKPEVWPAVSAGTAFRQLAMHVSADRLGKASAAAPHQGFFCQKARTEFVNSSGHSSGRKCPQPGSAPPST